MKKIFIAIISLTLWVNCNKKKFFDGPHLYNDDFETYTQLSELLLENHIHWSYTQLTKAENSIEVDSSKAHSGKKSLKFIAKKSDNETVSKSSITKQRMAFWEGETVRMKSWYFIQDTNALNWLFLMDLEEQAAIGAGPGMRIAMVDNRLRIEHKFLEKDIIQPVGKEVDFPRNQWVEIIWEVKLSRKNKGSVKLWQNGQLVINTENNRTLPKDLLYFQQGTKGMYSSYEIGITANSKDHDLNIWVDDIAIEKVE